VYTTSLVGYIITLRRGGLVIATKAALDIYWFKIILTVLEAAENKS